MITVFNNHIITALLRNVRLAPAQCGGTEDSWEVMVVLKTSPLMKDSIFDIAAN